MYYYFLNYDEIFGRENNSQIVHIRFKINGYTISDYKRGKCLKYSYVNHKMLIFNAVMWR